MLWVLLCVLIVFASSCEDFNLFANSWWTDDFFYIYFICLNMFSSGTTWHSVLYCIHSALLGGELSGFCFVLHSLRALLLVDGLMVRVGFNLSPWTSLHLPLTSVSFPHNIVCVKGLESCASKRLVSFQRPFFLLQPKCSLGRSCDWRAVMDVASLVDVHASLPCCH